MVYNSAKFKHRSKTIGAESLPQNVFGLLSDFCLFVLNLKQSTLKGNKSHAILRNFKLYVLQKVFDDP